MGSDLDETTNFDMLNDLTINNFPLRYKVLYSTYVMRFLAFVLMVQLYPSYILFIIPNINSKYFSRMCLS